MSEKSVDGDTLLTLKETLAYLRIGRTTLYRLMEKGDIQGYKVGSTWRFYLKDVKALIKARNEVVKVDKG